MPALKIRIKDDKGNVRYQSSGTDRAVMVYDGVYGPGYSIDFSTDTVPGFYIIRVDDTMDESYVWLTTGELTFQIPYGEKKLSYNPKSFTGDRHYITFRQADSHENSAYRNLALNVIDQHGDHGCFPHAHANVETRGESVFAARNAIDGYMANDYHGEWPYQSWGINMQDDAELTLDFGRPVDIAKIVLCTRADFPHDNWWIKASFTFSDGSKMSVDMEKSAEPHEFSIHKDNITWLKLGHLIKSDDPSPFPALTQIEVYGVNHIYT